MQLNVQTDRATADWGVPLVGRTRVSVLGLATLGLATWAQSGEWQNPTPIAQAIVRRKGENVERFMRDFLVRISSDTLKRDHVENVGGKLVKAR